MVASLLIGCFAFTGCDLGTYNQRLNEKPVAPEEEVLESDAEVETDDSGDPDTP